MRYSIYSVTDAGRCFQGSRSVLRVAFQFARRIHREYHGAAQVEVWLGGLLIEDQVSDMHLEIAARDQA